MPQGGNPRLEGYDILTFAFWGMVLFSLFSIEWTLSKILRELGDLNSLDIAAAVEDGIQQERHSRELDAEIEMLDGLHKK